MTEQQILTTILEVIAFLPVLMFAGHMVGSIRAGWGATESEIANPVPAMAAAVTAPRLVIPVKDVKDEPVDLADYAEAATDGFAAFVEAQTLTPTIQAYPVDWNAWSLRELRQIAKALGVKGFGRMNTPTVRAAIEAAIA